MSLDSAKEDAWLAVQEVLTDQTEGLSDEETAKVIEHVQLELDVLLDGFV